MRSPLRNSTKTSDKPLRWPATTSRSLTSSPGSLESRRRSLREPLKGLSLQREEKLKEKILSIQNKYKVAEGRFEYGEMNITKLNQRIDDIEDEIYREKLKIKKVADELGDTFDDMLAHY